jgi:hypothetical protein
MHDEKKPGDVLKVPGDPLADVAGIAAALNVNVEASKRNGICWMEICPEAVEILRNSRMTADAFAALRKSEESSGDRRRLGHISKQGNSLFRFLLVEAAQVTVRSDPECCSKWRCGEDGRSPK